MCLSFLVLSWEKLLLPPNCLYRHCDTVSQLQILIYDDIIVMQVTFNIEQILFFIYILLSALFHCWYFICHCLIVISDWHGPDGCPLCCCSWGYSFAYSFSVSYCQNGLATKVEKSRKQMKERKNRAKKIRGVKKVSYLSIYYHDTSDLHSLCNCSTVSLLLTYTNVICSFCLLQTKAGDAKKK